MSSSENEKSLEKETKNEKWGFGLSWFYLYNPYEPI
jgi:hypothetical protein